MPIIIVNLDVCLLYSNCLYSQLRYLFFFKKVYECALLVVVENENVMDIVVFVSQLFTLSISEICSFYFTFINIRYTVTELDFPFLSHRFRICIT